MLHKFNQALVEMASVDEAIKVIDAVRTTPLVISGRHIEFEFSKSKEINNALVRQPISKLFFFVWECGSGDV